MKSDCAKCGGTGLYQYDHNHSTICPDCCTHSEGVWWLTEHYLPYGKPTEGMPRWCCTRGCGKTWHSIGEFQQDPQRSIIGN